MDLNSLTQSFHSKDVSLHICGPVNANNNLFFSEIYWNPHKLSACVVWFWPGLYLLTATNGRQQQQQQGKGSGETWCPDREASIRVFPPKKSVISAMNFSRLMEWYLHRWTRSDRSSNVLDLHTTPNWLTHSEAMKLHSEEDRGTYSATSEVKAKT